MMYLTNEKGNIGAEIYKWMSVKSTLGRMYKGRSNDGVRTDTPHARAQI